MSQRVFLSYSHSDREFAKRVERQLGTLLNTNRDDLVVLDDRRSIAPGDDIRKSLKEAIDTASLVVFVVTPDSLRSQWVNYEAGLADALGKPMVIIGKKGIGKTSLLRNFPKDVQFIEVNEA